MSGHDPQDALPPGAVPPATERVLATFCHDLNGQLANAYGWLSLLAPTAGVGDGPIEHLRESLERMEALLRELRWLVRDPSRGAEPTSMADLLTAWESALEKHPRFHDAAIARETSVELPAVRVDFASALRVMLLAADSVAGGESVDSVSVEVSAVGDHAVVAFRSPGAEAGNAASRELMRSEADDSGLQVEWTGDSVRLMLERV